MLTDDHPRRARGVILLMITTFLWGTTFVITKKTLLGFPAGELVFARFLIGAIVFIPFVRLGKQLWIAAIELGIWLWAGFITQTVGLKYTTVNRSAFITSLHVIFVPVFAAGFGRKSRPLIWIAAVVALAGVGSHDGASPNRGDAWTILCAVVWAIYITRLETFTAKLPSRALTAAHLWVVVALSAMWMWQTEKIVSEIPWMSVLYLGLAATAATTWFQAMGQKFVTAPQAAVLYTMEPLWAALFGGIILGEWFGILGWIGAMGILLAAGLTVWPVKPPNQIEIVS